MRSLIRSTVALAAIAMAVPTLAVAQSKPVIAVMYFDNSSIGRDRADYDGVGKGIAEMLITDMAQNPNVQIVERERIQALLTEQNLVKSGAVSSETAIRLGRIIGAQYMVTGAFMSDGRGHYVLTARAINVETSAISNPTRIDAKGDDVLGLIAQLSSKLNADMKLPALHVGDAGGIGGAMPAGHPIGEPSAPAAAPAAAPAVAPAAAPVDMARAAPAVPEKTADKAAARPMRVARAKARKMDMKTALLYSKALEEEDAGNTTRAVELYRQVDVKFPEYAPVQRKIARLSRG